MVFTDVLGVFAQDPAATSAQPFVSLPETTPPSCADTAEPGPRARPASLRRDPVGGIRRTVGSVARAPVASVRGGVVEGLAGGAQKLPLDGVRGSRAGVLEGSRGRRRGTRSRRRPTLPAAPGGRFRDGHGSHSRAPARALRGPRTGHHQGGAGASERQCRVISAVVSGGGRGGSRRAFAATEWMPRRVAAARPCRLRLGVVSGAWWGHRKGPRGHELSGSPICSREPV
jgi:hypothetical protein